MDYKEISKNQEILKFGELNENFFIILEGSVGVHAPNPAIERWDWAMSVYQGLL